MNFLKKNIIFTIVMALTLLGAIYLIYLDWTKHDEVTEANSQTLEFQEKYDNAFKSGTKPVPNNIKMIQKDTEDLQQRTRQLQRIFGKPYRKALLRFAASLKVSEDDLYVLMKKVFENDENKEKTAEYLVPKFFEALEKEKKLTKDQVDKAYKEFVAVVRLESLEEFKDYEKKPEVVHDVLAAALGLQRTMKTDRAQRYMEDIQLRFQKQGLIPGVKKMKDIRNFTFYFDAPPSETEVVDILNTMPIYEDIFKRMKDSGLELVIAFAREKNQPVTLPGDKYLSYEFSTTVSGTMESVRNFINNLLNAYKDNRVYVVTWISMTSPDTQAEVERMRNKLKPRSQSDQDDDDFDGTEKPPKGKPPKGKPPLGGRRPSRKDAANPNQAQQADAELDAYGCTVIGKNRVTAVIRFKYYMYVGDRLKKK
ncbi:MAG: hypothetical protein J5806_12595 [Lentisphaeria bacterium]|nr:hypothetical protein [Lentisphaeria bacterium]